MKEAGFREATGLFFDMETVLITDTHYNNENVHLVDDSFKQCFNLAKRSRTKSVFHLGDWFTSRTGQTLPTLMAVLNILNEAQRNGIKIHTIPGNHDKSDLEDERSFMSVFQNHPAISLYSAGSFVPINANLRLHMLPYFPEEGSYGERLEHMKANLSKGKNTLLTHITLDGALNNDGSKQSNYLTRDAFKGFDWVLSGHYHNRNSPWSRAQYIGSPRAANYGEDNDKGFTIINADGSMKFVRSTFQQFHQFFFDLTRIDDDAFAEDFERAVELAAMGHRVRAVVVGTKELVEAFDRKLFTDNGIEFVPKDSNISKSIQDLEEGLTTSFTTAELMRAFVEYCKLNGIKGEMFGMGLKLMKSNL